MSQSSQNKKKILITGGHATPAYAVIDELVRRDEDKYDFVWIGKKHNQKGNKAPSAEFETITKHYNFKFINFNSGKLVRHWSFSTLFENIKETFKFGVGLNKAFWHITRTKPNLVLTFGGYNAVPIVFAAKLKNIPIVAHEQTLSVGLANRMIARWADKFLVSWKITLEQVDAKNKKFVGNPVRKDIFENKTNNLSTFDKNKPTIYITGGNQGAHEINKRIFDILHELLEVSNVVHQTGNSTVTKDYQTALKYRNSFPKDLQNRYLVFDYVNSDMIGEVLTKADLVVSRSGANIITELLILGKRAVLIPIPWSSGDEQTKNAKMMEPTGLAIRLVQSKDLTSDDLHQAIKKQLELIEHGIDLKDRSIKTSIEEAKTYVTMNADKRIADEVEEAIDNS